MLLNKRDEYAIKLGSAFDTAFDKHVRIGISAISVAEYSEYKKTLELNNFSLDQCRRRSDKQLCSLLTDAVGDLNQELRINMNTEIAMTSAKDNLAKTDKAILDALGVFEADQCPGGPPRID